MIVLQLQNLKAKGPDVWNIDPVVEAQQAIRPEGPTRVAGGREVRRNGRIGRIRSSDIGEEGVVVSHKGGTKGRG